MGNLGLPRKDSGITLHLGKKETVCQRSCFLRWAARGWQEDLRVVLPGREGKPMVSVPTAARPPAASVTGACRAGCQDREVPEISAPRRGHATCNLRGSEGHTSVLPALSAMLVGRPWFPTGSLGVRTGGGQHQSPKWPLLNPDSTLAPAGTLGTCQELIFYPNSALFQSRLQLG